MIVVGIDPGTRTTGYAVLECARGQIQVRDLGAWKLVQEHEALGLRLEMLFEKSRELFRAWNPHWVGLEKAVAFKNISSSLKLSEARGVIRLAVSVELDQGDQRIVELSPTEVKKKVSGRGLAPKQSVSRSMMFRLNAFGLKAPMPDTRSALPADAYDALAIAWTTALRARAHVNSSVLKSR